MDIGRAFTFVFGDPEWVKKILIGGLVSLIPVVGGFMLYGYMLQVVRQVYQGAAEELPDWSDLGGYLARGLLFTVALFIWLLPALLVIGCLVGGAIGAGAAADSDALVTVGAIIASILGSLVIAFWAVALLPVLAGRYAVEDRFGSMFEIGEILQDVRRAGLPALLLLLVTAMVAGFLGSLGLILCFIGVIFTTFYSYVVIAHAAGQVYRQARGLGPTGPRNEGVAF